MGIGPNVLTRPNYVVSDPTRPHPQHPSLRIRPYHVPHPGLISTVQRPALARHSRVYQLYTNWTLLCIGCLHEKAPRYLVDCCTQWRRFGGTGGSSPSNI